MKAKETKKTIIKAVKTKARAKVKAKVEVKPKASVSKISAIKPKPVKKIENKITKKRAVTGEAKIEAKVKAKPKASVSKISAIKPKLLVKAEKKAPKKKAVTAKIKAKVEVKTKPKSAVSKISAIKPKPAVKAEKKAPKKKAVAAKIKTKVEVKTKPKSAVSKVAAIKPKPAVKAEKKAPNKRAVAAKIKTKVKETGEKTELKRAPGLPRKKATRTVSKEKKAVAAKREPVIPVNPSLKSVAAARKHETREEPKPKAEQYPVISSKARLKIFLPDQDLTKEEAEKIFFGGLPEEYGENSVIALVVDPNTVFVDWEVIPKDISDLEGDLNLRFYDITGIEFNDWNAHAVLDVPINKRVGSGFFEIRMPGRDVVVAVGILDAVSGFMPIVRSDMVSFPELLTFDELGIVQKLFESGIPVGY